MRRPAERAEVERFLSELGRRVSRPARVLVTGGASMILRGLRQQTLDVDIAYTVAPEHDGAFVEAVRELKDALQINVEFADPGKFIPMPGGREHRMAFHGRYGSVDVLLDDPYAIALSKLDRGKERDFEDVGQLAAGGFLTFDALEAKAREIAAPTTPGALRVDLDKLLARLERVRRGPAT